MRLPSNTGFAILKNMNLLILFLVFALGQCASVEKRWDVLAGYKLAADGYYYKFYSAGRTWKEAEVICKNDGGHLAIIWDARTRDIVQGFAGKRHVSWVGATDEWTEGRWETPLGYDVPFAPWYYGEPNNAHGNEDCAQLMPIGLWNDSPCDEEQPFTCQIKAKTDKEWRERIHVLQNKVKTQDTKISTLQEKLKNAELTTGKLKNAELTIGKLKDENKVLQNKVKTQDMQISTLQEKLKNAELTIGKLQNKVKTQDTEISTLQEKLKDAKLTIGKLQNKVKTQDMTISTLQEQLKNAKLTIGKLQNKVKTQDTKISTLQEKFKNAELTIGKLQNKVKTQDTEISTLQDGNKDLQNKVKTQDTQILTLQEKLKKAEVTIGELKKEIQRLTPSPLPLCEGYEKVNGRYVKYFDRKMTWKSAKEFCKSSSSQLITIKDEKTTEWLKGQQKPIWIGAYDLGHEGKWTWVDGTQVEGGNWNDNEPNNGLGMVDENCAVVNSMFFPWWVHGKWADRPCSSKERFACESPNCTNEKIKGK